MGVLLRDKLRIANPTWWNHAFKWYKIMKEKNYKTHHLIVIIRDIIGSFIQTSKIQYFYFENNKKVIISF